MRAICDRRNGVGADGLVILTPSTPDAVRMAYWNSDGSHGAMCGNAALCSGRLAVDLEMVPAGEFCLLTDAGLVRVSSPAPGDEAEINLPGLRCSARILRVSTGSRASAGFALVTVGRAPSGGPGGRHRSGGCAPVGAGCFGPTRAWGPAGANVNFVSPAASPEAPWLIRTYERGVEGETLACGTGTVAAALALACPGRGRAAPAVPEQGRAGARAYAAELDGSRATGVWLGGQGRLVFRGVWEGS